MNKQMKVTLALSVLLLIGLFVAAGIAANTAEAPAQDNLEDVDINELINDESQGEDMLQGKLLEDFEPVETVDELQIIDVKEGTGDEVQDGNAVVNAHYTGAVAATGVIFQSSYDSGSPVEFGLDRVIEGWTKGVPGMKIGGTRRLIIPAEMAYGSTPPPQSGIPADAPLVFDITLEGIVSQ